MLVLFSGSRDYPSYAQVRDTVIELRALLGEFILMHGCAPGTDTFAGLAGKVLGMEVLEDPCAPEEWERYGKAAGKLRNTRMLKRQPDYVVTFLSTMPRTGGTLDTIDKAVNIYRIPTLVRRPLQ